LECLRLRLGDCLQVKVVLLALWHLDNSLTAIAAVRKDEGDRLSDMLNESVLEVLQQHAAEELLDVSLEQDHSVTTVPALKASIERILKERHGVFVSGGEVKRLLTGCGRKADFGSHCRVVCVGVVVVVVVVVVNWR
jgi:hypothetical protein